MRRALTLYTVALAGWLLFSTASAFATDIRIDLSNLVSTTAGNWNNISAVAGLTPDLIDYQTGLGTGVSMQGIGPWANFYGDDYGAFPDRDWVVQPATKDGAGIQNGQTGSYDFTGLAAGTYRIEVVSARTTFGYQNYLTVNGAAADSTYLGTPVVTPWNSTTDGLAAGNWLMWDLTVPTGGTVRLTDSASSTLGIVNAVRIVSTSGQVPEPGSLAMMAGSLMAALGVAVRGRRKATPK